MEQKITTPGALRESGSAGLRSRGDRRQVGSAAGAKEAARVTVEHAHAGTGELG
jgi:hypothetical protein